MRSLVLGMVAIAAVVLAAGTGAETVAPTTARADDPVVVRAIDNLFQPAEVTVAAGATVMWSNEEGDPTNSHDVSGDTWFSPLFRPGETWSFTFTEPGVYSYLCDLHDGMVGKVIVQ